MKNSLTLKEIDVAIKDPKYLKHQNHTKLIPIANEIIESISKYLISKGVFNK